MAEEIVLEHGRADRHYWLDLWRYRELLVFLAWRDVSVHYKQTLIGVAWAVLRPVSTMLVFTLVFSKVARLPSDGVPYLLLVLGGMLPWQLFATSLGESSNSLVGNANLISKVYFPRLLVPLSSLGVALVDFAISLPVLVGLLVYYEVAPTWRLLALPLFVVFALAAAVGAGFWLAALNVRYRDVRYVIPFLMQFGMYLSPVGYSTSAAPEGWRWVFLLNPMAAVIDGVRWSLFGTEPPCGWAGFAVALGVVLVLLAGGVSYFRKTERTFVDVI
jgi:lipopolysaccharide transport system permease protein